MVENTGPEIVDDLHRCKGCSQTKKNLKLHLKKMTQCINCYDESELAELFKKLSEEQRLRKNEKQRNMPEEQRLRKNEKLRNMPEEQRLRKNEKLRKKKLPEEKRLRKNKKLRKNHQQKKQNLKYDQQQLFENFMQKQSQGTLSYVCVSCHRLLFKSGVTPYETDGPKSEEIQDKIKENNLEHCVTTNETMKCNNGRFWICYTCKNHLLKGKMPNMCHANGLDVNEMPENLRDLTYLELLMIKKKIIFIKVRDLKNSGMKEMKGKITNVPIQDEDVLKTAGVLPRLDDELGTVNVAFKYMKKGPYYRKAELIRPNKIDEALRYLTKKHPSYFKFPIDYINDPKKYKFVQLPLIGYHEEDDTNLKTLDDAFTFMENSTLLTELLSPSLDRTQSNYQNLMSQLVVDKTLKGPDSFIHALFDQMR